MSPKEITLDQLVNMLGIKRPKLEELLEVFGVHKIEELDNLSPKEAEDAITDNFIRQLRRDAAPILRDYGESVQKHLQATLDVLREAKPTVPMTPSIAGVLILLGLIIGHECEAVSEDFSEEFSSVFPNSQKNLRRSEECLDIALGECLLLGIAQGREDHRNEKKEPSNRKARRGRRR